MSLRELHAAQTREIIVSTALELFLKNGYEGTTMEAIASRAGVGTTTLYRYFPSKDLLVIAPFEMGGQMAAEFRARPAEESLAVALGHALRVMVETPRADSVRLAQCHKIMESTPSLRARLFEAFVDERSLLERAVAERIGRPEGDVFAVVTARLTTLLLEMVGEPAGDLGVDARDAVAQGSDSIAEGIEALRSFTERLEVEPPVIPRLD